MNRFAETTNEHILQEVQSLRNEIRQLKCATGYIDLQGLRALLPASRNWYRGALKELDCFVIKRKKFWKRADVEAFIEEHRIEGLRARLTQKLAA